MTNPLLELVRSQIAELEAQLPRFSAPVTDDQLVAAIEELVHTASIGGLVRTAATPDYVPARDHLAQLTAAVPALQPLIDSIVQRLARRGPRMHSTLSMKRIAS
jgi:hypothetical protein